MPILHLRHFYPRKLLRLGPGSNISQISIPHQIEPRSGCRRCLRSIWLRLRSGTTWSRSESNFMLSKRIVLQKRLAFQLGKYRWSFIDGINFTGDPIFSTWETLPFSPPKFWPFSPPQLHNFKKYQNLHHGAFKKYHFLRQVLRKMPNSRHVSILDDK